MESKPQAILLVDDRFPNDWTVAIGFPRYWIDFLSCPIVNISYQSAWDLSRNLPESIQLKVDTSSKPAKSQNVIAEIKGTKYPDEIVVISGHHDSVLNNPGPDDNASGVASTLELARIFVDKKPLRTMRFISYGAEEQLSEGARHYAESIEDPDRIKFVLNSDAIGAFMGTTKIFTCGPRKLDNLVNKVSSELDFPAHLDREVLPFSDHFFLEKLGVPGVWYYRLTYLIARHFHHSRLETPEVISPEVLRSTVVHQTRLLEKIVMEDKIPFPREIPKVQQTALHRWSREWVGE
jgi:Iap family predicted aminopeptidase